MAAPGAAGFIGGRILGGIGTYAQITAVSWYVFHITGDPRALGILTSLSLAASVAASPIGGLLANRYPLQGVAAGAQIIQAVICLAAGLWAQTTNLPLAALYVLFALLAGVSSLGSTSLAQVLPDSVPGALRPHAIADSGAAYGVARVVGPVVGGVLVLLSGLGVVILFNAASFLVFAAVIMRMPIRRGEIREGQVLARKEGFWAQVSRGVRTPVATVVLAGLVVFYLLVDPVQSQLAAIAARESPNPLMVSLFMSALACGSVIVNPLLRRAQSRGAGPVRILLAGCLGSAVPVALLGATEQVWLAVLLLVVIGMCMEVVFTAGSATMQLVVSAGSRSAMLAVLFATITAAAAVGSYLLGVAMYHAGVSTALIVGAAAALGASLAVVWFAWRVKALTPGLATRGDSDQAR